MIESGKVASKTMLVHILHYTALFALLGIRFVERKLVRVVYFIRGRHNIKHRPEKVSSYLKDLAEEQRKK